MKKYDNLHDCFQSNLQNITYNGNKVMSNNSSQTELLFQSMEIKDPTKISIDHCK